MAMVNSLGWHLEWRWEWHREDIGWHWEWHRGNKEWQGMALQLWGMALGMASQ